jgi:hypothetical protein
LGNRVTQRQRSASNVERVIDVAQVQEVVQANPSLTTISVVGNSLGGLYARYALSLLFDPSTSLIAGLQPGTFLTIASPHLGVRRHLGFPVSLKSGLLVARAWGDSKRESRVLAAA